MSISNIILNQNNLSLTSNVLDITTQPAPYNKLQLNLGSANLQGKKIALNKISMYYSWPNITNTNNTFSISWPTGTNTYTNFSITIPAFTNYSTVADLNTYLQTVLIANGLYLINSTTSNNLYYIQFVSNPNLYGVSLVLNVVPTSLPAGYTAPANFAGYPSVARTMKLTTDTSDFNLIIGYAKSTVFDGNTATITYNSLYVPQFSPVSSINVTCNLANNAMALNNDSTIIYTATTAGVSYGSIIKIEPTNLVYYDIATTANILVIAFTDQNGVPLYIKDPAINIFLLISN